MSINNKEQISIHIKKYRNLSNYTTGRFALRVSLYTNLKNKIHYALPINVIQKKPSSNEGDNQPITQEWYYMTKSFAIKGGANADIDEICIFRFDVEIGLEENDYTQIQNNLTIELIHQDYTQMRIVGEFCGKFKGIVNDSLIVDFYENCPGQLIGSIHSCILSYEYVKDVKKTHSKSSSRQNDQMTNQVLKYLKDISERNLKKTIQNLSELKGENISSGSFDKNNVHKNEKENTSEQHLDLKTESTQQDCEKNKRKRKPIFDNSLPLEKKPIGLKKSFKLFQADSCLHQNSMKIYEVWRELNELLITDKGDRFIQKKQKQFNLKLRKKVGESVIRFKGSKDIDEYSDYKQIQRRNLMINQLRNQPKQLLALTNEFSVTSEKDFTRQRPIFFQQSVIGPKLTSESEKPIDFMLIFLVHGLGACRLDMQKLKVELKRYHQNKIKIYVSTVNQSRTEGDIDGMGFRLASQVEAEITRTKGNFKVSMIGHSMGGLIIRSALPRLQKFKEKFHSFVTFSSPHIGYAYSTSKLVDAGLWILNTMKKCTSIEQMTMIDSPVIEECFLYKLSQQKGLQWFRKITFLASHQDLYVPFYSARIQKSKEIQTEFKKGFSRGVHYCKMIDNILSRISGKLTRLDINFCIQEQNIDNLIGRAAHISFINNAEMLRTFCLAEEDAVF